jgi:hypothetical protein
MRGPLASIIVMLALFAVPATCRADEDASPRQWYVGVAYGPARAKLAGADSLGTTSWLDGPSQSIRVGRILSPSFRLGFEHQAWLREQGFHDLKIRSGVQLEALGVTAYPWASRGGWSGLYLSAGTGWAHCRLTFLEPLAPGESPIGETYEIVFKQDEYGWGGYAGLGYEFRISRSFAAGVMLSYNRVDIGGSIYDHAAFVPLVGNLNWSF